jgi:hypothetical protein
MKDEEGECSEITTQSTDAPKGKEDNERKVACAWRIFFSQDGRYEPGRAA